MLARATSAGEPIGSRGTNGTGAGASGLAADGCATALEYDTLDHTANTANTLTLTRVCGRIGLRFLHCDVFRKSERLTSGDEARRWISTTSREASALEAKRVTRGWRAGPWVQWCRVILAVALLLRAQHVRADDPRNTYLIKLLQGSSQFRVRAQAAISLGAVTSSGEAVGALTGALGDAHPAVRAAAANSLGRIGTTASLATLRKLQKDPEEPVRSAALAAIARLETTPSNKSVFASARSNSTEPEPSPGPPLYYVAVTAPATQVKTIDRKALADARLFIKQRVGQLRGVVIAPDGEDTHAADRVLKSKNLKGFSLDSAIVSVENKGPAGTRVSVSVIVATYPGRDMRAIMQGAATVSGSGADASTQALEGALSGALRQLPQALAR